MPISYKRKPKRKITYIGSSMKKSKTSYSSPNVLVPAYMTPRTGLGTRKAVKMIYSDKGISLTTGPLGAATFQSFRINSVFDPDFTGIGHQPSVHDQMAAIFEQYVVTGVRYRISFSNSSATNRQIVGVYASDRDTTSADPTLIIEQGAVQYRTLAVASAGGSQTTFTGYVDIPQLMGKTRQQYTGSTQYCTEFGSNPADQAFLHCFGSDITNASGSQVITITAELVFDVLCLGTKLVPQS